MKRTAKMDRSEKEGHGEDGPVQSVRKGKYTQVGTTAPLSHSAISVNSKTGHVGAGEE